MKYRKKLLVVEAFQLGVHDMPDWFSDEVKKNNIILHYDKSENVNCYIKTLTNETIRGDFYDFIIKDIDGKIYPCAPSIFDKTYEIIDNKI
jgi:hypothetical protein